MRHTAARLLLGLALLWAPATVATAAGAPADLDRYNVVWTTPSHDASGAMPIGNGELGLNLWVEPDGDLRFYLARTDTWSEACRLLKLGGIRVSFSPNPFTRGGPFRQELSLRDGRIDLTAGQAGRTVTLTVFVDARAPVVHLIGESAQPVSVRATLEDWRTVKKVLKGEELSSSWTMQNAPANLEVWEAADVLDQSSPDAVVWYHRNEYSIVPLTLKHQSLEAFSGLAHDPLLHRTFGARLAAAGFVKVGADALQSATPVRRFAIQIATHTAQTDTPGAWRAELAAVAGRSARPRAAARSTAAWWQAFWDRSWVFVKGDQAAGVPENTHPLRIGADSDDGDRFQGLMSRASLFARPLTAADVTALAAGDPSATLPPALRSLATWRLINPAGDVVRNTAGVGLDAQRRGKLVLARDGDVSAARFTGGHLEVANDPRLSLPDGFTLEAWIKPDASSGPARIFDKLTAGSDDGFLFDTYPGHSLRLITGDATLIARDILPLGQWSHVAATFDPRTGVQRLFLNGELVKASDGGATAEGAPPSQVTQAFLLQRWMSACAGRGHYPIKFNGSIFTVDPQFGGGPKLNADWRRWGDCFWWQNSRFPYFAMLANGDFAGPPSLFRLYRAVLPLCEARAQFYYGARGAYFPETMTLFGTYANQDYGWDRAGHAPGEVLSPWWCYAWQQGLELVMLMEDYYDYTGDRTFLADDLVPMAHAVLSYFDTRFPRDAEGKLVITPTQAVETYWHGVTNDTPAVAGLNAVVPRLLALPPGRVPATERGFWAKVKAETPPLAVRGERGMTSVPPARDFDPRRSNVENPELYAVWPFRLFGVGQPGLATGVETFRRRGEKSMRGWSYDGQCAAILGLTDEARRQILSKARNSNPSYRFPAMWGPNYDWVPDQDHGSNILLTLQNMLLCPAGRQLLLLPAWPKDWDVRFKLHAPQATTVECEYRGGKVVFLRVTPAARRRDVVLAGH